MPSTDRISAPAMTFRWSSNSPADRLAVENPATGEVIAIVQGGGAYEVDQAVKTANQAFERDWRWPTSKERERILLQCADVLEAHADELAELESRENGKPIVNARVHDVNFLIQVFRFFGSLIDRLPSEFYDKGNVPPTLFTGVTRDMRVAVEEIFGPVVTVTVFDTEEEAISIANESEYGLMCGIYSRDAEQAFRVAHKIEVGMVFVNNYYRDVLGTPFGGTKHSGYGREHSIQTLQEFGRVKMIRFPSGRGKIPSWRGVTDIFGDIGSKA